MNKILIITLLLILGFASGAQAISIDFGSDDFKNAGGESSYTYNGVTAEALLDGSTSSATLFWTSDGLGVDSGYKDGGVNDGYEDDEIEENEILHLHFDTQQFLQSILLANLFNESYGSVSYSEKGSYSFDNNQWIGFTASSTSGNFTIDFSSSVIITDIWFKAPGWSQGGNHEYTVAGVEIAPVPEPATMLLFGTGLAGLAGLRHKFKKA